MDPCAPRKSLSAFTVCVSLFLRSILFRTAEYATSRRVFLPPSPTERKEESTNPIFQDFNKWTHSVSIDSERPASTKGMSRAIDQLQVWSQLHLRLRLIASEASPLAWFMATLLPTKQLLSLGPMFLFQKQLYFIVVCESMCVDIGIYLLGGGVREHPEGISPSFYPCGFWGMKSGLSGVLPATFYPLG